MNDGVYKPEQVVTKHATKVGILKFWQLNYGIGKFQDLIQFTYNWRVVFFFPIRLVFQGTDLSILLLVALFLLL